jgi:hypothetical protein
MRDQHVVQDVQAGQQPAPDDPEALALVPQVGVVQDRLGLLVRAEGDMGQAGVAHRRLVKARDDQQGAVAAVTQACRQRQEGLQVAAGAEGQQQNQWRRRGLVAGTCRVREVRELRWNQGIDAQGGGSWWGQGARPRIHP